MRFAAIRNLLLSLVVLGAAGAIIGAGTGTFALFNAVTTSTGNTFSSANITFADVMNFNGANAGTTCTSTSGATASGTGCTTALGSLATMVPGDSKVGTVRFTNSGNVTVSVAMAVSDAVSNVLTSTAIGTAATSPSSAGLGLLIFQCTTSGGVDQNCKATDTTGKLLPVYYSTCNSGSAISLASPGAGLPVSTSTFNTTSLTDNGIKVVGSSTVTCYGGNTTTAFASLNGTSNSITLASTLAPSGNLSLAVLVYFPPSTSSASFQNLSGNSVTYTWTATQIAGTSQ